MMGTILPAVCGNRNRCRSTKKPKLLALHALGYMLGAVVTGTAVSMLGLLILILFAVKPTAVFVFAVTGTVSLLYGVHELGFFHLPVPQSRRQVPQKWRRELPLPLMVFLYGLGLGPGFFTAIPVASFYVLVTAIFLQADLVYGGLAFAFYGLGRVTPLIMIYWTSNRMGRVSNLSQVVYPWKPLVHLCNGLTLSAAGAALIVWALTSSGSTTLISHGASFGEQQACSRKADLVSVTKECFDEQCKRI